MYNTIVFIHLVCAIVWMGGMSFMLAALRPAVLALENPVRAKLMLTVWRRFFTMAGMAVVGLLLTGGHLYAKSMAVGVVSPGKNIMAGIGVLMFLIFGHIVFAGFRKYARALAAGDSALAQRAAATIHTLVIINFCLGWLAIAAIKLL
jgi:uncharacterized membrane protein